MIGSRDRVDARTLTERARWAEWIGCSHICVHDHLADAARPDPAADRRRDGDRAHPALPARVQQRSAPPGRPRPGAGEPRHPQRWARGRRHRGGLERARVPGRSASPTIRPATRIDRMTEAIAILRGLFADGPFSYSGRYYTITEMDGQPKPVQRPHPPFLIGGTRERVLRLAAREADIVGLDLRQDGRAILDAFEARTDVRVGWIRDEAGDRLERARPQRPPAASATSRSRTSRSRPPPRSPASSATGRACRSARRMSSSPRSR